MPDWLAIPLGLLLGGAVIFGAVFLAARPYVLSGRRKPWMPDPSEKRDEIKAWTGWQDHHPPPGSN